MMIGQVLERPETESPAPLARLTAEEVERITRPLYERSLAEMKAYWNIRFEERRQKPKSPQ